MQKYFLLVALLTLTIATHLPSTLTLDDCYHLAIANSDKMSLADLRAMIEEDRTREIWGIAFPQLSGQADLITKGDAKHVRHHKRTKNAKVSLIIPIYNFGGAQHAITAQEKREESAIIDIDRARQEVLYATNHAYFILLEAQKLELILKESLQTLQVQYRITKDFKEQGLVHENEMFLVEVEQALLQQDYLQAQNYIALSKAKLNRLIGYELDYPTEIEDILEQTNWDTNLYQILCEGLDNHPVLKSLSAKIEAASYTHRAAKGDLFPSIYGFTNYSTTDDYALPYKHGLDAGIGVRMTFYDGGTTWAKIKRLKKEVEEMQQRYAATEKDIELGIRSAFLNAESAFNKIPLASKSIALAERSLKITQDHFGEGLVTNADVINDEENLLKARSNYYQSLYQFHKAKADLAYAAGQTIFFQGCQYEDSNSR